MVVRGTKCERVMRGACPTRSVAPIRCAADMWNDNMRRQRSDSIALVAVIIGTAGSHAIFSRLTSDAGPGEPPAEATSFKFEASSMDVTTFGPVEGERKVWNDGAPMKGKTYTSCCFSDLNRERQAMLRDGWTVSRILVGDEPAFYFTWERNEGR